jgi:hypothetical protein
VISTFAGNGKQGFSGDGGQATSAPLTNPVGVAVDAAGHLYIADEYNKHIRKVTPAGVITSVAGNGTYGGFSGDGGPAALAQLDDPVGVAVDAMGNLYIADQLNNRIRKVNPAGVISTFAGDGTDADFSGDGGRATLAPLNWPAAVAVDAAGNLYIAAGNRIQKVTPAGVISTVGWQWLLPIEAVGCDQEVKEVYP